MRVTSQSANAPHRTLVDAGTRHSGELRSTHGQSVRCVAVSAVCNGITRATGDRKRHGRGAVHPDVGTFLPVTPPSFAPLNAYQSHGVTHRMHLPALRDR